MKTKVCSKCKQEKTLDQFHKAKKYKEGVGCYCKECSKAVTKNYIESGRAKEIQKNGRRKNVIEGQCSSCKESRLSTSRYCLKHWLWQILASFKLKKEDIEDLIPGLILKLEKSEYSCFYTGLPLVPGLNASLDHRLPQSKGGTHSLSNLEWVHFSINRMKQNLSEKEFINRSAAILVEMNSLASRGVL